MLGHGLGEASSNIVPGARSTTIAPDDKWDKFPREQENMKDLWETISAAVTQKDIAILEASELKNFNSIPRKEIGVKARHFVRHLISEVMVGADICYSQDSGMGSESKPEHGWSAFR